MTDKEIRNFIINMKISNGDAIDKILEFKLNNYDIDEVVDYIYDNYSLYYRHSDHHKDSLIDCIFKFKVDYIDIFNIRVYIHWKIKVLIRMIIKDNNMGDSYEYPVMANYESNQIVSNVIKNGKLELNLNDLHKSKFRGEYSIMHSLIEYWKEDIKGLIKSQVLRKYHARVKRY